MSLVKFSSHNPSLFNRLLNEDFFETPTRSDFVPAVNVKENENSFQIEVAAPGLSKEDFKIELTRKQLNISAQKAEEKEENSKEYKFREFSFNNFKRSFKLPEHVNGSEINAKYENGILVLDLPKIQEKDPNRVHLIDVA